MGSFPETHIDLREVILVFVHTSYNLFDLMNEAEYLMKNYGDRGGYYPSRQIIPSEISIILHMIRKPNSMIVLLFIQNNS